MTEERRVVAVLFATVDGLERLGASLPADEVAEAADALMQRLSRTVQTRGGTVDKIVGDTLMAVFGAPVAYGDDPRRAVRAALAIRGEIEVFAAQWKLPLALRAGINLGEVLWGSVGGDRPTAMGDVVNVASRLAGEAAAGEVLVAAAARRSAGEGIAFGPETARQVRGRHDPVEVSAALREEASAGPGALSALVGRDAPLAKLRASAQAGRGTFVVIEGEAGIGKSRLAREFAAGEGWAWVGQGGVDPAALSPLGAFAAAMRADAGGRPVPMHLQELLAATVPDVVVRRNAAHLLARSIGLGLGQTSVRFIAPERAREETGRAWDAWAGALLARGPALLVLEDIHAADAATLALLERLAKTFAGRPLALVATARPGAAVPAGFEVLPLGALDPPALSAIARDRLGRAPDPGLASFLAERSGGNPRALEELVRYVVAEGLVDGDPARLVRRPEALPDGLRGLLVARMDALSAEAREALKAASVFGVVFWTRAAADVAERDLAKGLTESERAGLTSALPASLLPGDHEMQFEHAPLRDAGYSLLTRKERQRLHERIAARLEPLAAEHGRRFLVLAAAHREQAGETAAASRSWAAAASRALVESAFEEALDAARSAQRLDGSTDAALVAVRAMAKLGLNEQALAEANELIEAAGAPSETGRRARYELACILDHTGKFQEGLEVVQRLLKESLPADLRETARFRLSGFLSRLSRLAESKAETEAHLADLQAREATGPGAVPSHSLARAIGALGSIEIDLANYPAAEALLRRAHDIYRAHDDRAAMAGTLNSIGISLNRRGRRAEATAAYDEALAVYRDTGERWCIAMVLTNLANTRFSTGDHAGSYAAAREGLQIRHDIGDPWGAALIEGNWGSHLKEEGRYREALPLVRNSLEAFRGTGDRSGVARTLSYLGSILGELGESNEAEAVHSESIALFAELGIKDRLEMSWSERALTRALTAPDGGEAALREAIGRPDRPKRTSVDVSCRPALARVIASKLPAEAETHIEAALECSQDESAGANRALALGARAILRAAHGRAAESLADARLARKEGSNLLSFRETLLLDEAEARALLASGNAAEARRVASVASDRARAAGAIPAAKRFDDLLRATSSSAGGR